MIVIIIIIIIVIIVNNIIIITIVINNLYNLNTLLRAYNLKGTLTKSTDIFVFIEK